MKTFSRVLIPAALLPLAAMATATQAAVVHVRPITIELQAPASAATLTLTNKGKELVTSQVRVFRWTQVKGRDVLKPTRDVVVSPPILRMRPGRENVIRVVRTSKRPVRGQENYRIIVDQLPGKRRKGVGVVFAMRYSIPVFFFNKKATPPRLSWKAVKRGSKIILTARNSGERHERIARMKIVSASGKTITVSKGLAGYVLGKSYRMWNIPAKASFSGVITIKGQGIYGPIRAKVRLR